MLSFRNKIILDCDLMRHPNSGLYHYCLNLGKEVKKLQEQEEGKSSIKFYVPPEEARSFDPASTIVEKKSVWNLFNPFLQQCRVWHAPFQSGRIIPARSRNPDLKVLLTIHDLNPLHEGKPREEQQKSLAHTQSLIDRSDALVCISKFCKEDVVSNCEVGNKPVHVIHNGTHQVHRPFLTSDSYRPSRPFLFGLGYVNTKKNYHVLLPLLKNEELELIIAGKLDEPEYIDKIKTDAQKLGISDRLHILGPVPENDKAWYFENCLAFVHPSLAEGFGAPVVEAMQFGKPIFLSPFTSLPEIGGDAAFYFTTFNGDHMQQIFEAGMKRYQEENMLHVIKERAQNFNWNQKAKEYLSVYRSLY